MQRLSPPALVGLVAWAAVLLLAVAWGRRLAQAGGVGVSLPPLSARWDPQWSIHLLALAGMAAVALAVPRLPVGSWWRVTLATLVAFGWIVGVNSFHADLGGLGGLETLAEPLTSRWEYAASLDVFDGPADTFARYVEEFPELAIHPRGHPPGPLAALEGLVAIGIDDPRQWALLVVAAAASAVVPLWGVTRRLSGEVAADRLLPLLVLVPFAVWLGTSVDAVFMAAAAWTAWGWLTARHPITLFAAGAAGGCLLLLSYGLVPFGLVLLALRPQLRALAWGMLGTVAVLAVAAAAGFWYLDGMEATRMAYEEGIASRRPYGYWIIGDLGALAIAAGPWAAASIAVATATALSERRGLEPIVWPVVAATAAVGLAAISGFTRAEVERIWLPYMPWLLLAAPMPQMGAMVQAAWAAGLAATLVTPW